MRDDQFRERTLTSLGIVPPKKGGGGGLLTPPLLLFLEIDFLCVIRLGPISSSFLLSSSSTLLCLLLLRAPEP